MSSVNISGALANSDLFKGLTQQELGRLERLAHRRHYEPGEVIIQEGKGGIAFFVLTSGRAQVTRTGQDGKQHELRTVGPGGVFGEMALFTDRPRSATITAVEPTDCLALHRLEFIEELRRSPDVALRLLDTLAARLGEEYDRL